MGDRCTGHCCRAFHLPFGPDELRAKGEASRRLRLADIEEQVDHFVRLPDCSETREEVHRRLSAIRKISDVEFMADNAVYLGQGTAARRPMRIERPEFALQVAESHYYTCKLFDAEAGNCTAYDTRPKVCSGYPYGRPCLYTECTCDEARSGKMGKGWAG